MRNTQSPCPVTEPVFPFRQTRRAVLKKLARRVRLSSLITLASLISGCMLQFGAEPGTDASPQPASPTDILPAHPTDTPIQQANGWELLAPGLERRTYRPAEGSALTTFVALRVDPSLYTFRAHYRPGAPLFVSGWIDALPDAVAFVNANFFDQNQQILGLLVSDGVASGRSFAGFGGFLQVQGGQVRVRSNIIEPYAGEPLEQAVQAFPMLVTNGSASYSNSQGDRVSRRTVAGQDSAGRIILMVTSSLVGMRLVDLSQWLPTTDLDLVNALNLDGGGSSMLSISVPTPAFIPSFDAVPAVLAVYAR